MSEKENQNELNIENEGEGKYIKALEAVQQEEKENQQNEVNLNPETEQILDNNINDNIENNLDNNNEKNKEDKNISINIDINNNQENLDLNYINVDINNNGSNNMKINEEEKKSKTKEDYELEINNLKQELNEKNALLISLKNSENPEYKIPEILGKIEAQNLFEMINENKIKEQRLKIDSIKRMVKSLDEQFKHQLKMKEQKINKKLEPFIKKNKDLLQEINSCKNQMNQLKERLERSNNILTQLQKEKGDFEESIIKREEKLNLLLDRLNLFEDLNKRKTKLLKENEMYSKELIKIIEEQKEEIREFEKSNDNNKYIIPSNNIKKSQVNERYNINNNNDITNDINNNNNITQNDDNNVILPNIYNNNNKKKNKNKNETEKVDYELDKKEEENNNHKLNEFKNLMDDLYNNIIN